ncbi:hypothetical protein STENM327S_04558 [Streptomyces tendae]
MHAPTPSDEPLGVPALVDSPDLLPFTSGVPLLPVRPARAAELAELFQVRRLSESVTGRVDSEGTEHGVPEPVRVLLGRGPRRRTWSTGNWSSTAWRSTGG